MKKLFAVVMAAILSSTSVFAGSVNSLSKTNVIVKDESSIADVHLIIEPKNQVETGTSIFLSFENAKVFEQDIIDGVSTDKDEYGYNEKGYQYLIDGNPWNTRDSFYDVMPNINSAQLPYHLRRINDKQVQVDLINLPDIYADNSLSKVNGVGRSPYYSIPLVVYADGVGEIKMTIDSNESSISDSLFNSAKIYEGKTESTTAAKETTTEATTEATTENTVNNNKENKNVRVQIGANYIMVDNEKRSIDVPSYIQTASQSTLVPLRAVIEAFGGNDSVNWNGNTKTATIKYKGNTVEFTANGDNMTVNGVTKPMPDNVRAEIKDGRMFVPFRVLGEAMGLKVEWEAETKTAIYIG